MVEETKVIATDDGKSEHLHSTRTAGEPTRGTPPRRASASEPSRGEGGCRATEPFEGQTPGQRGPVSVFTKLERIAKRARERPQEVITTLNHLIDKDWLKEAYARTRKNGAVGVDGQTADEYE